MRFDILIPWLALFAGTVAAAEPPATVSLAGGTDNLVAGQVTSVRQVVRLNEPMEPGGAILVARHWLVPAALQNIDQRGTNHISVESREVSLRPGMLLRRGLHGGLYGEAALPVFELGAAALAAGGELVVTYDRLQLPTQAINRFKLPIYIRSGAGADWQYVDGPALTVRGGRAERLEVFNPGQVETGAPVNLLLRITDSFGNLATGSIPSLEVLVDGEFSQRIEAGMDPTPLLSLAFDAPGRYRIDVRSAGGGIRAMSYIEATTRREYETRWIELHAHTNLSDGIHSASEVRQRFIGVVDDLVMADHDTLLSAEAWTRREQGVFDAFVWSSELVNGGHYLVLAPEPLVLEGGPRAAFPDQRTLIDGVRRFGGLMVALAEVPADLRHVDPASLRLVEIKAGEGTFEWFGNQAARRGLRVGFTGSAISHVRQADMPSTTGRTAVQVARGETLFDALAAGRTWVTSGPRIGVAVTVNGVQPGSRAPAAELRQVAGSIRGTAPIHRVELIRNGEVVETREYARRGDAESIRVTFESETAPLNGQADLPRNGREWIGYLRVTDAAIAGLESPGFLGERQAAVINPRDPSRIDFITWTRGQPSSFLVDIDVNAEDVVLEMALKSGFEDADQVALGRQPAEIPSATFVVSLQELIGGTATRGYEVDGYHDKVSFELVDKTVPTEVDFQFNDRREHAAGDYYYIRVTQLDDHQAWSSPVFVGGFDFAP